MWSQVLRRDMHVNMGSGPLAGPGLRGRVETVLRWAHVLMAILFLFAACWSFASPFGAFWALATVFGLLLIFRGSFDLVTSISSREINPAWWLWMVAGVLEILLGFWVSQQEFPARALLLLIWVAFFALFRGFSDILLAFEVRGLERR